MASIKDIDSLKDYIGQLVYNNLGNEDSATSEIVIAVNRFAFMQANQFNQLQQEVADMDFDPDELEATDKARELQLQAMDKKIAAVVSQVVAEIKQNRALPNDKRSTAERVVNDYFFPALFKARTASAVLHDNLLQSLENDPHNAELNQYQQILDGHIGYLDAIVQLPFAAEKLYGALQKNNGQNYSPRQNAQVVSALLDTLQKSHVGGWTANKLLQAVRVVTKMTMPDIAVDSVTLESIQDLLPIVNDILAKGNALETQKAALFADNPANPKQAGARKALYSAMGVEFTTLATLCYESLYKPVQNLVGAAGNLTSAAGQIFTYDGKDLLQFLNSVEEACNVIQGVPNELLLHDSVRKYAEHVKRAAGVVAAGSKLVAGTGTMIGTIASGVGTVATNYAPDSLKQSADELLDETAAVYRALAPTVSTVASYVAYLTPYHYTPYLDQKSYQSAGSSLWNKFTAYLPEYVKRKFSEPGEFWEYLKPSIDPAVAEDFFYIHGLVAASNTPALEKEFFESYMTKPEVKVKSTYAEYVEFKQTIAKYEAFKAAIAKHKAEQQANVTTPGQAIATDSTKDTVLIAQLADFVNANEAERGDQAVFMIQRLKELESEIKESGNGIVQFMELERALRFESTDPKVEAFQKFYVRPTVERAAVRVQQNLCVPALEKALDGLYEQAKDPIAATTAFKNKQAKLREIYSRLKGGQILTMQDLNVLAQYKVHGDKAPALSLLAIAEIVESYSHLPANKVAKAFTPKEEERQSYQTVLETVHPVCGHISEALNKQLAAVRGLLALKPTGSVKTLCEAKINYLLLLDKAVKQLMQDIKKDDQLAEEIRKLVGGEVVADATDSTDAKQLAKQLVSLSFETLLPKSGMVAASMPEKILAYAMSKNSHLRGIVEAKHGFEKTLKKSPPPPELIGRLGDPLKGTLKNEVIAKKAAELAVDMTSDIVKSLAGFYAVSIPLAMIIPSVVLADIAVGVLTRPEVQSKIGSYINDYIPEPMMNLVTATGNFFGKQKDKLTDSLKEYISPMLNLEVQKVLEHKAYTYAITDSAKRATLTQYERDAFSSFYLQYRAIKKNNPALNKDDCVAYLFGQSLAAKSKHEQTLFVHAISAEFERVDAALYLPTASTEPTAELENELQFLMGRVNFDAPSDTALVGMTIYNRLLIMQFEADKELTAEQSGALQQKAMQTLEAVLTNLEKADAKADLTVARTHTRAEQLIPATKLAAKIKLDALRGELGSIVKLIDGRVSDREEQLKADKDVKEPKRLGRTVLKATIAKDTKFSLPVKLTKVASAVATPILFWTFVGVAIHSHGFLMGALTAFDLVLGPVGIGLLAAMVAAKVAYHTFKEVRARDNEFDAIKNSNASPLKKVGLTVLTGLKCFGIGLIKAVITDTLFHKVNEMLVSGFKPIIEGAQSVRDLVRSHPTRNRLETEVQALRELQTQLKTLQSLVEEQIKDKQSIDFDPIKPDPKQFKQEAVYAARLALYETMRVRAEAIENLSKDIAGALKETQELLKKPASRDARWEKGVNEELVAYGHAFAKLNDAMKQVNTIKNVELRMQPRLEVTQKPVSTTQVGFFPTTGDPAHAVSNKSIETCNHVKRLMAEFERSMIVLAEDKADDRVFARGSAPAA